MSSPRSTSKLPLYECGFEPQSPKNKFLGTPPHCLIIAFPILGHLSDVQSEGPAAITFLKSDEPFPKGKHKNGVMGEKWSSG